MNAAFVSAQCPVVNLELSAKLKKVVEMTDVHRQSTSCKTVFNCPHCKVPIHVLAEVTITKSYAVAFKSNVANEKIVK